MFQTVSLNTGLKEADSCCSWLGPCLIICLGFSLTGASKAESFELSYLAAQSEQQEQVRQVLVESERLEYAIEGLNQLFNLPLTIKVNVGGEQGPLHDPAQQYINIPYEFVSGLSRLYPEREDLLDVTVFVLYHEVGHALIDLLELPVPAELEESADGLAGLLSIELISDGGAPVLAAAGLLASRESIAASHPWFGQAGKTSRSRKLICWVVGSDPGRLGWVAEDAGLEAGEADRCPNEYEEMRGYWVELLRPYLRRR